MALYAPFLLLKKYMLQVFVGIVHLRSWFKPIHQRLFLVTFPPRQWLHPTLPPLHQGMSLVRWGGLDDKVTANKLTWNAWWRAQKKKVTLHWLLH